MAFSKPIGQKIFAKTEAKTLGKAEVEWEIVGWNGPLSHEIRSKASCVVNIPTIDNLSSEIKLHFHLKPYHCHDELTQKYCTKKNQYVFRSSDCSCATCSVVPLKSKAKIPLEFLPKTGTQSAGYSLLVDVLSPQDDMMISVSVVKLNGEKCTATNKVVSVQPGSARENLLVERNFWRMLLWTVDKSGNIGNCTNTIADTVDDARFALTVTAYKLTSTVTEGPKLDETLLKDTAISENEIRNTNCQSELSVDESTFKLPCNDEKTHLKKDCIHVEKIRPESNKESEHEQLSKISDKTTLQLTNWAPKNQPMVSFWADVPPALDLGKKGYPLDTDTDNDSDHSFECVAGSSTPKEKAQYAQDVQKLEEELADLMKRFQNLKNE